LQGERDPRCLGGQERARAQQEHENSQG
jgi:hypothetical protein